MTAMASRLLYALSPLSLLFGGLTQCQPTSVEARLAPPAEVSDDVCRIPRTEFDQQTYEGNFATAFPFVFDNLLPDQNVDLLVIPVEWSNHRGTAANMAREFDQVKTFTGLYTKMSNGKLSFNTIFGSRWYRLPEPIQNYPQKWTSDHNSKVVQHAVDAIDPEIDFSIIDLVIVVFPDRPPIPVTNHKEYGFASMQHFNRGGSPSDPRNVFSDEGWVRNYVGGAGYFDHPLRPVWSYYVHEVGHVFSLPDWYIREANQGEYYVPGLDFATGPMSHWDAMSSQDGPSRTFSAWTRWLLGWLDDSQVACFDAETVASHGAFDIDLVPLDIYEPGTKAVMVRTGPQQGIVIESRRPVFPDHDLVYWERVGRKPSGIIVYFVDATKGNSQGTLSIVPPVGQGIAMLSMTERMDPRLIDGLYNKGAVGFAEGMMIQLIRSGNRDTVRITPLQTP